MRPVCCFGLRGRTAPPRCCCSTARCGAIRAAPGACRAVLETATRRRNRPRSANRARRRACPPSDSRCGPRWSPPRCAGSTTRTGPTPPLSPMPGSCWTPCPTGKAPNCAGWPRTRWPTCRYIPDSPPVGNDCGPLRRPCHWPGATNGGSGCRAPFRSRPGFSSGVRRATRIRRPRRWVGGSVRCCKRRPELLGRRTWVVSRGDRPHHHDPASAGIEHGRQPLRVDAADSEPRLVVAAEFGGDPYQPQTRRRTARLGRCRPTWSDTEIVGVAGGGRSNLVGVVGGPADEGIRCQDLSCDVHGQVALTQMQHVGAGRAGNIGAVVDRE
ncbi:Putative 7,8-dihydro-8-oxoguanine-triphosphatase [Mycobacterium tuberculosis variant bovis]|nr:Putative 7,8-dihydro-8-oxoguanine-triphosphatase [Mycobacterium tuberculosis variant bovis]CEJ33988.1 Putative 7,8-dihydro-8-oxoguanine-triphosphatase [Mycobacterium tuberculosis variant bovis]CEJ39868.1 Putative 7,8-dihydro-8-oxoguanine-triphosphatase [Mycobacterium tuberculosis variant bovis]CEJ50826.1 Putative 7,8-dihydro-8-oxoguanine-triphosphatase [Mycobacterium tuberculosis variant caprae]